MNGIGGAGATQAPWQMMFEQVRNMLLRYRHSCHFPLDFDDVVRSALPTDIFLDKRHMSMRWQNLSRTIRTGRTAYFEIENDTDPKHGPFYLHMDWDIPVPQEEPQVFLIAQDNPYLDELTKWVTDAYAIDEELEQQIHLCRTFLTGVKHPTFVEKYWPDLMPFIGEESRRLATPIKPSPVKSWQVSATDKAWITDTLAKCALLPDHKCMAWVAFDVDETGAGR
jgi:hypothetical protein